MNNIWIELGRGAHSVYIHSDFSALAHIKYRVAPFFSCKICECPKKENWIIVICNHNEDINMMCLIEPFIDNNLEPPRKYYFNANKAWIPARNIDKIIGLEEQEESRRGFLRLLQE